MIFSILTLIAYSSFKYPIFTPNVTDCHECIESINSIRQNNTKIINMYNNLYSICSQYNNTDCQLMLNKTEHWLLKENSTNVCEYLGFCDKLSFSDYITSFNEYHLFKFYNRLLVMNSKSILDIVNSSFIENMTLVTEYGFNETLIDISILSLPYLDCESNNITLLKVTTDNYMYYYNTTKLNLAFSVYTGSRYNMEHRHNYKFLSDKFRSAGLYIVDWFYNSTLNGILGSISNAGIDLFLVPINFRFP